MKEPPRNHERGIPRDCGDALSVRIRIKAMLLALLDIRRNYENTPTPKMAFKRSGVRLLLAPPFF
jgi:hypothetical protein